MENIMTYRLFLVFVFLSLVLVGCRQSSDPTPDPSILVNLRYEPDPPVVGEGTVIVVVRDALGNPIDNALVNIRGDMNHAGMVPVIVETQASVNGEYSVPFNWNMGGDWILTVTTTLADGSTTEVLFNVTVGG
jgi:hypothetical protein